MNPASVLLSSSVARPNGFIRADVALQRSVILLSLFEVFAYNRKVLKS